MLILEYAPGHEVLATGPVGGVEVAGRVGAGEGLVADELGGAEVHEAASTPITASASRVLIRASPYPFLWNKSAKASRVFWRKGAASVLGKKNPPGGGPRG